MVFVEPGRKGRDMIKVMAIGLALQHVARPELVGNTLNGVFGKEVGIRLRLSLLEDAGPEILGLKEDHVERQIAIFQEEAVIELIQGDVLNPGVRGLMAAQSKTKGKPPIVGIDVSNNVLDRPFARCAGLGHSGTWNPLDERV